MIRVAVLGAGNHSRLHGESLVTLAGEQLVELAAVCDLDRAKAEAYRAEFGFARCYGDLEEMLERESPDLLLAITPLTRTVELAHRLLAVDTALLIEKPPGLAPGETLGLAEAAQGRRYPHFVSFNRRFSPALTGALSWIAQQRLDPPFHLVGRMLRNRRTEEDFVIGTGIHLIDAVCGILGTPVSCETTRHGKAGSDVPDSMTNGGSSFGALIRFAGGASANLTIAPDSGTMDEAIELIGPGYSVSIDMLACRASAVLDGERTTILDPCEEWPPRYRDGTLDETRKLIRLAVSGGSEASVSGVPIPTLATSYESMSLAETIARGRQGSISLTPIRS